MSAFLVHRILFLDISYKIPYRTFSVSKLQEVVDGSSEGGVLISEAADEEDENEDIVSEGEAEYSASLVVDASSVQPVIISMANIGRITLQSLRKSVSVFLMLSVSGYGGSQLGILFGGQWLHQIYIAC